MLQSKHFEFGEFASHDGALYPTEWVQDRLQPLCDMLDLVRDAWGGPIHVVSGYRSPAYNEQLRAKSPGVAKNSQHVQGRAADIAPIPATPQNVARLYGMINQMLASGKLPGIGGFGRYPSWVHVDVREKVPASHIARWTGAGVGSEPT